MKSCPTCQQVYPDNGPDYCTNDGTPLVSTASGYNPGAAYSPGTPPGGQWQQPGYGYQPQPPPGGYPPYGYAPVQAGGEGLANAAMWTGISAAGSIVFGFLLGFASAGSGNRGLAGFAGLLGLLSYLVGLTAIILGIVAASMASRNPNINRSKAILGICLGAIPYVLLIIFLIIGASVTSYRRW